jgi:hypothetical protein
VVSFIGTLTVLPVVLAMVLMARSPTIRESVFGVVSGVGLLLLYIGWIHRTGYDLDPRPWVGLGSALLIAGIVGHALRSRQGD